MNSRNQGITVITTHINADFDALASMLAAQKLYPGARVVLPGSQEKNMRNFFVQSMAYLFNMAEMDEIDFADVRRLVLVDTRQPGRIGKFTGLIGKEGLEIHIYDHHPPMPQDIRGHIEICETTGATVTLLTEILAERNADINADEATILALGIYEDTGSFTFASTTPREFQAAAFLLSKGANLNVIANLIAREISPEQVGILNDMIQAAQHFNINGVGVVVTTITSDHYLPDFAFLVHKMAKMENLDAIFAIASMGAKIYVIARSRIQEVDVGGILAAMGGGGHNFAASAAVKGKTLAQVEQKLFELLNLEVRSNRRAKDLMSSPAIVVGPLVTCQEASRQLTRYNVNALLVTEKQNGRDSLLGYITRQVIEKALYHQLHEAAVKEYMTTDPAFVAPEADLQEIQRKIIVDKQRILPVVAAGTILGVVTRTDLLNLVMVGNTGKTGRSTDPVLDPSQARTRNVGKFMRERLSKRMINILRQVGRVAQDLGISAFVVGGFVRDLFLYRPNEDLDIVIEGDGIGFAKSFAALMGARIHSHEKFGTAVVIFPDGFKMDVASARMEYYRFPAALPEVEMSSIKLDLYRRDFTINTLAIQLNPRRFGTLIDFFAAQRDIKEKVIRVLHNLSFVEDPTRVFRAIRFEQRFGFTIGKLTSGLIENAVRMNFFQRLSGRRVFSELRLILEEKNPSAALVRMKDYDLVKFIHPTLELNDERIALFENVKKVLSWHDLLFLEDSYMKWAVYFLGLVRHCGPETAAEICERFELPPRQRTLFIHERFKAEKTLKQLERSLPGRNSTLYHQLVNFKIELILYMMAATVQEPVKRSISYFYTHLRDIRPNLRGKDLEALGISPGPVYGEILEAILNEKLDGRLDTVEDELSFARAWI